MHPGLVVATPLVDSVVGLVDHVDGASGDGGTLSDSLGVVVEVDTSVDFAVGTERAQAFAAHVAVSRSTPLITTAYCIQT